MTAPINLASRFTLPDDPIEYLRMLQGLPGGQESGDRSQGSDAESAPLPDDAAPEDDGREATAKSKSGRKANGQFAEGNLGGPGNPYNRQVAALRKQLLECLTPAVFQKAAQALITRACAGDTAALKLLFQYSLGKPLDAVHPDRVAIDEAALVSESNNSGRNWRALTGAPILETFLQIIRALQVISTERFQDQFTGALDELQAEDDKKARRKEAQRKRQEAHRAQQAQANGASSPAAAAEASERPAPEQPAAPAAEVGAARRASSAAASSPVTTEPAGPPSTNRPNGQTTAEPRTDDHRLAEPNAGPPPDGQQTDRRQTLRHP